MEEGKKKNGGDNVGDDFDDNDNPIYRNSEGNIIPAFKTREDRTVNNLLDGAFVLNNFWNSWDKNDNQNKTQPPLDVSEDEQTEREELPAEDNDRKEADVTLNRFFQNTESHTNRKVRFDIPEDNEDDE